MELINSKDELIKNIETLEYYINEGKDLEVIDAKSLIKRGTCFVVYKIDSELHFAPSRFIGYRDNNLDKHLASEKKTAGILIKQSLKF